MLHFFAFFRFFISREPQYISIKVIFAIVQYGMGPLHSLTPTLVCIGKRGWIWEPQTWKFGKCHVFMRFTAIFCPPPPSREIVYAYQVDFWHRRVYTVQWIHSKCVGYGHAAGAAAGRWCLSILVFVSRTDDVGVASTTPQPLYCRDTRLTASIWCIGKLAEMLDSDVADDTIMLCAGAINMTALWL